MRAPGRDVATHGAGADHMDMLDRVAVAGELLHLLAQEEHADQVLRRRRHHQPGERTPSRPSASPRGRRRASPTDRSARKARDNARAAQPSRPRPTMREARDAAHRREFMIGISGLGLARLQLAEHRIAARRCGHGAPRSPHRQDRSTFALRASMVLPVSISGIACIGLTRCVKRAVPPKPGCRPSITSGKPKRAPSMAMRIWQASATSRPPPRQKP